jgi:hypothetical protein
MMDIVLFGKSDFAKLNVAIAPKSDTQSGPTLPPYAASSLRALIATGKYGS